MKYLILLSLVGCSSYEPRTYRITTTTMTCPKDYMYNSYDGMCYYIKPLYDIKPLSPELQVKRPHANKVTKRPRKRLETAKEESINCVKALHYCGVNDGKL